MPAISSPLVREHKLTLIERFAINVIKVGHIPRHVAFIMDGNRRFSKKSCIDKKEGHSKGFEKLSEILQWCQKLGTKEVTAFAFSIENFNRSEDEVSALMELARENFELLLGEKEKLHERGICIRVIGNLTLLPEDIIKSMAKAILLTKNNTTTILNIAFAYTSRDEITNAVDTISKGVKSKQVSEKDINESLINACLYTNLSPEPDLLVRTSGELRFSDFLLWQTSSSVVNFTYALWPECSIWQLLGCILHYQQCYAKLKKNKAESISVNKLPSLIDAVNCQRNTYLLEMSQK